MRAISLEMSAFGPFCQKTCIDFRDLGESGLFIITGVNGAGKTTIFDAITYALYGAPSDANKRDMKSYRSDFATMDMDTYVKFVFSHQGRTYEVQRNPEYERRVKKGSGTTKQTADATLVCLETSQHISSSKTVTAKVEEILGLTQQQFAQTAMIAQGAFVKILNATSNERTKLFQEIFHTKKYSDLTDMLKKRNDALSKDKESREEEIQRAMLKAVIPQDRQGKTGEPVAQNRVHWMEVLEELRKEDAEQITLLKKMREEKGENLNTLQKEYGTAERINESFKSLEKQKKEMEVLLAGKKDIETEQTRYDLAQKAALLEPKEKLAVKTAKDRQDAEEQMKNCQKTFAEGKKKCELQDELCEKYKENTGKAETLTKQIAKLETLRKPVSELEKDRTSVSSLDKKVHDAYIASDEAEKRYQACKEAYFASQYAGIAKELKENVPCPVCGSSSHPHPARYDGEACSKEEMSVAEDKKNEAAASLQRLDQDRTRHLEAIARTEEALKQAGMPVDIKLRDLVAKISEVEDQRKGLLNEWETARNEKVKADKKLVEAQASMENARQTLEKMLKEEKEAREEFETKLKSSDFASEEAYRASILSEQERNILKIKLEKFNDKEKTLKGGIQTLTEELKGKSFVDLSKLQETIDVASGEKTKVEEQLSILEDRQRRNQDVEKTLVSCGERIGKIETEWKITDDLYKTASGNLPQKMKISLETYVQKYYFQRIVSAANVRLNKLTEGMYYLRCKPDAKDGRTPAGLDLDVLDRMTGKWRHVSTLSTGESFKATLALALGLSDVVSEGSGTVRLESMFIDEGFGSLDEESLNHAKSMLVQLASGNRSIGVISHVDGLKNWIDHKIEITKNSNGSTLVVK